MKKTLRQVREEVDKNMGWAQTAFYFLSKPEAEGWGVSIESVKGQIEEERTASNAVLIFARNIGMITNEEMWKEQRRLNKKVDELNEAIRGVENMKVSQLDGEVRAWIARKAEREGWCK